MTATMTQDLLEVQEDLLLSAAVDVKKIPTVTILAYTGGIMRVGAWGDVVIDLAGLDLAGSVAILSDHDSTRRGIVGHGRARDQWGSSLSSQVHGASSLRTRAAQLLWLGLRDLVFDTHRVVLAARRRSMAPAR